MLANGGNTKATSKTQRPSQADVSAGPADCNPANGLCVTYHERLNGRAIFRSCCGFDDILSRNISPQKMSPT